MSKADRHISQLYSIRNKYGGGEAVQKLRLLENINNALTGLLSKSTIHSYYDALLFLIAYPDNASVYREANASLRQLQLHIGLKERFRIPLYNTGITGSSLCAAYSFELVKWLRAVRRDDIRLVSFEAGDAQIQSILSVVMSKLESEVLQDGNAEWKGWLKRTRKKGDELLDQLINIFDSTSIRPEVKDELWNTIGINTEIDLSEHCSLPQHLIKPYYHRSLQRKHIKPDPGFKATKAKLNEADAKHIIDCSRMILVRHLRELDPISFTAPRLVSYYHLQRGISIALTGMVAERRHPIDSYMGYVVFKNGVPVAYAGSWILFDSARIGLNVFPSYRGGESQYIFQQVLQLHQKVYGLKRFSVDPYQLGKGNSDGIHSGAFWVYYHAGFRPIEKAYHELAEVEAHKIKTVPGYRSPAAVLKKLADCRLELVMDEKAVRFDATDLSVRWAEILEKKYSGDRVRAAKDVVKKMAGILGIRNYEEAGMRFVLENWGVILLADEKELRRNKGKIKKLIMMKAYGVEEEYIKELQGEGYCLV